MRKIKPCLGSPTGRFLVGLAILLYFSATALAQPPQAPAAKPEAVNPAAPKAVCQTGTCVVRIECPPIKTPGKTICTATIDCPPPQEKAKEKPKPKQKKKTSSE